MIRSTTKIPSGVESRSELELECTTGQRRRLVATSGRFFRRFKEIGLCKGATLQFPVSTSEVFHKSCITGGLKQTDFLTLEGWALGRKRVEELLSNMFEQTHLQHHLLEWFSLHLQILDSEMKLRILWCILASFSPFWGGMNNGNCTNSTWKSVQKTFLAKDVVDSLKSGGALLCFHFSMRLLFAKTRLCIPSAASEYTELTMPWTWKKISSQRLPPSGSGAKYFTASGNFGNFNSSKASRDFASYTCSLRGGFTSNRDGFTSPWLSQRDLFPRCWAVSCGWQRDLCCTNFWWYLYEEYVARWWFQITYFWIVSPLGEMIPIEQWKKGPLVGCLI